jgi:predicted MFS family arabinose efflux permease
MVVVVKSGRMGARREGCCDPYRRGRWGTWLSRVLRDEAEAGGGLQVAIIHLAITAGAAIGGMLFDSVGWQSTFGFAAVLLTGSSVAALAAWRNGRTAR